MEEALDVHEIQGRVRELEEMQRKCEEDVCELCPSDAEKLLKDCIIQFQSRVQEMVSDCSDVDFSSDKDLDACLQCLSDELKSVEADSARMSNEIEILTRTYAEDFNRLEFDLQGLKCSLDFTVSQDLEKRKVDAMSVNGDQALENTLHMQQLELENEIENKKLILRNLQDLHHTCKWSDDLEQVEDAFTGIKVIALDENYIRLSLRTYIPKLQGFISQQNVEGINEPYELNHELLIEVLERSMDIKNVEIFPNDVCIDGILDATKLFSKSSLQWFVTKVQDRIILCTMRRLLVKSANKSWHSLEYSDKDETIVAHLAGGVDAFIKVSQGWPISSSPLNLTSLKSSDLHSKGVSLSFLCKVKEGANSLALNIRQNLSTFVEAVEKILLDQFSS